MKYFGKLIFTSVICLLVAALVILTNGNQKLSVGAGRIPEVVHREPEHPDAPEGYEKEAPVLVLYSPGDALSVKYKENLEDTFSYLKWDCESLDIARTDSVSYKSYRMVVIASQNVEAELKDGAKRLFSYVEDGGRLFWGVLQSTTDQEFKKIYKKMGIVDYGNYVEYQDLRFERELLPGISGQTFENEGFLDVGLFVRLNEDAKVYLTADVDGRRLPVIWSSTYGNGRVACYNGVAITGDFYRGIAAGCVQTLYDTVLYPVINAKCIFIDDFPSPQYESTSDIVRKQYNRNVRDFYRDIWWPDMQKAANKFDYVYTGLFIATYNDIVDPKRFEYTQSSMEQYYGNSLMRAGNEMGAHGYNHQSLAESGQVPESMGYRAWESEADMEASLQMLLEVTEKLFPGARLSTYVPPSNYLSDMGRQAVKKALPDLKVISGVYTNEGEEGSVYMQRFEIAEDGVAEFPRITSGMLYSDFERMEWFSALGLHGVFSHFIHPDDIFDEERGGGRSWEVLRDSYEKLLADVNQAADGLRSLSAAEAGDALMVYQELKPRLVYEEDRIRGSIDGFRGEAFFFLHTEKKPRSMDDACTIRPLSKRKGEQYYLVQAKAAEFTILLEEEQE